MRRTLRALTFVVPLAACRAESSKPDESRATYAASHEPAQTRPKVRWFGALREIMHEGRTESRVKLAEVVPGPRAWGLGALEGLHGEVTLLDDVVWLARPATDGSALITRGDLKGTDREQGAALLVVANVNAWDEVPLASQVAWSELDDFLSSVLAAREPALAEPVPVRIVGPVAELRWHVVDGSKLSPGSGHAEHARTAVSGVLDRTEAELVGFYSQKHAGIFTHAGSRSHFHVVTRDGLVTGHVDAVDVLRGARLLIGRE